MPENEMYDMVIMCAQALKEQKMLQYFCFLCNDWNDINKKTITDIVINITHGTKYRVKPEPKTGGQGATIAALADILRQHLEDLK